MNENRKHIISAGDNEYNGMKIVLINGSELAEQMKKAQELSCELEEVNRKISCFKPAWRLKQLKEV